MDNTKAFHLVLRVPKADSAFLYFQFEANELMLLNEENAIEFAVYDADLESIKYCFTVSILSVLSSNCTENNCSSFTLSFWFNISAHVYGNVL